ncbi:hypothetical protein NPIL_97401 [Nephila pilipes]|uniref:Uncharacterized protein n=1 Tax=Nephila pilipes TaxID=299642 RepID=A0A8X6NLN2_NEPPI|nr:hypothetical protein NPIL_97401 [Nephila pilipes]
MATSFFDTHVLIAFNKPLICSLSGIVLSRSHRLVATTLHSLSFRANLQRFLYARDTLCLSKTRKYCSMKRKKRVKPSHPLKYLQIHSMRAYQVKIFPKHIV